MAVSEVIAVPVVGASAGSSSSAAPSGTNFLESV